MPKKKKKRLVLQLLEYFANFNILKYFNRERLNFIFNKRSNAEFKCFNIAEII